MVLPFRKNPLVGTIRHAPATPVTAQSPTPMRGLLDLLLHTPASVPSVAEEGDSSSGKGVNGLGRSPLRDILLHSPCITRTSSRLREANMLVRRQHCESVKAKSGALGVVSPPASRAGVAPASIKSPAPAPCASSTSLLSSCSSGAMSVSTSSSSSSSTSSSRLLVSSTATLDSSASSCTVSSSSFERNGSSSGSVATPLGLSHGGSTGGGSTGGCAKAGITARDEYDRMEQWAFEVGKLLQAVEHQPASRASKPLHRSPRPHTSAVAGSGTAVVGASGAAKA